MSTAFFFPSSSFSLSLSRLAWIVCEVTNEVMAADVRGRNCNRSTLRSSYRWRCMWAVPYRTLYYTCTQLVLLRKQCFAWKLSFYKCGTLRRLDRIRKFLPICSSALISLSHTLSHLHYSLTLMAADRGKKKWEPKGKANLLSFSGAAVVFLVLNCKCLSFTPSANVAKDKSFLFLCA